MDNDPRKPPTGRKENRRMKANGNRGKSQRSLIMKQGQKALRAFFNGNLSQTAFYGMVKDQKADLEQIDIIDKNQDDRQKTLERARLNS